MITFFRRALSSWIVLGLLGLILVAFLITGVNAPSGPGGAGDGGTAAKVGSGKITAIDLNRRVRDQFEAARREQPTLDAKTFLAAGAFEQISNVMISMRAVESWGADQGFRIGKRLIDAEIAGYPAFRGITGQFDETTMRAQLAQARISEKDFRQGVGDDLLRGQILSSVIAPVPMPLAMARPYATLLVEKRVGSVGIIPLGAVASRTPPTEAEIAAAYKSNIAAYTRGEMRSLRYALLGAAQVAEASKPTEAEVADYYRNNAATYAAKDTRDLTQVIAPTEAAAKGIAAAASSGGSLQAAATKVGLEASALPGQVRADYVKSSNAAVAAAAFDAARGGVVGPVKGAFGWYVVRVDAIKGLPARSLDQARAEIVATLTRQKQQDALSELSAKIDDSLGDGASFEETVRNNKLTMITTPPLLQSGQNPEDPAWKAPPEVPGLLKSAFAMGTDDKPVVETLVPDQLYALVGVARIIPPTPMPLAQVRNAVVRDIVVKRTAARAKTLGDAVVAAVNKGVPLAKAMADTGVALPPVQPASARQLDLMRAQQV
ncbi:SurA N-terminal domain-containing protein, partial [Novosphingobium sp.]|uniref:peptidylprolyl isomerase n=1 Tax=Novosphingobium sp. TaxID=1874826 RepID=UPI003529E469